MFKVSQKILLEDVCTCIMTKVIEKLEDCWIKSTGTLTGLLWLTLRECLNGKVLSTMTV